jgi:hypothetical protein
VVTKGKHPCRPKRRAVHKWGKVEKDQLRLDFAVQLANRSPIKAEDIEKVCTNYPRARSNAEINDKYNNLVNSIWREVNAANYLQNL